MRISYTDWWNDVLAIGRANASILVALAGAFVFLPALAASFALVPMMPMSQSPSVPEAVANLSTYLSTNWLPLLLTSLLSAFGQLMVYLVLLDSRRPSVGDAFRLGVPLFILFFILGLLTNLLVSVGLTLFLLPGFYLIGRVMLSAPAFVAERRTNPVAALSRSWELTRGQGWRIFFFVFLILVVALVVQIAVNGTLGSVLGLMAGDQGRFSLGKLFLAALEAGFAALFWVLAIAIWVALYRRLVAGMPSRAT